MNSYHIKPGVFAKESYSSSVAAGRSRTEPQPVYIYWPKTNWPRTVKIRHLRFYQLAVNPAREFAQYKISAPTSFAYESIDLI
jgi:hypothetical protein